MRRLRHWWWSLPLIALAVLAVWAVHRHMRDGGLPPFGPADREARAPDGTRPEQDLRAPREAARAPARDPFIFMATRDGGRITFSGSYPAGDGRAVLVEEAKQAVPDALVFDELKASGKAPVRLEEAAVFGIRQLARLPSATFTVRDDRIALVALAPDIDSYNAVLAALRNPPEGFAVDSSGLAPPLARPYTWSATSREGEVALVGHVPSEAARKELRATAAQAFPDKQLLERVQPASGLPASVDFTAATRFALTQLAKLRAGTAELVDATLSLRGDVLDKGAQASVRAAVQGGLPSGLRPGSMAVTVTPPSPYAFRARREAGTLTLSGYYPDDATRAAIHQFIGERFFSEQVVDKLRPADGAPKNYLAGVSFALENMSWLASGEVVVSDRSVRVSGEALYEQTAERMARTVPAMTLPGWTGKAEVRVRSPEQASDAQPSDPQP